MALQKAWEGGGYAIRYEGDPQVCNEWHGWAVAQFCFLLPRNQGTQRFYLHPAETVDVIISLRPNSILIRAGGIYVTFEDWESPLEPNDRHTYRDRLLYIAYAPDAPFIRRNDYGFTTVIPAVRNDGQYWWWQNGRDALYWGPESVVYRGKRYAVPTNDILAAAVGMVNTAGGGKTKMLVTLEDLGRWELFPIANNPYRIGYYRFAVTPGGNAVLETVAHNFLPNAWIVPVNSTVVDGRAAIYHAQFSEDIDTLAVSWLKPFSTPFQNIGNEGEIVIIKNIASPPAYTKTTLASSNTGANYFNVDVAITYGYNFSQIVSCFVDETASFLGFGVYNGATETFVSCSQKPFTTYFRYIEGTVYFFSIKRPAPSATASRHYGFSDANGYEIDCNSSTSASWELWLSKVSPQSENYFYKLVATLPGETRVATHFLSGFGNALSGSFSKDFAGLQVHFFDPIKEIVAFTVTKVTYEGDAEFLNDPFSTVSNSVSPEFDPPYFLTESLDKKCQLWRGGVTETIETWTYADKTIEYDWEGGVAGTNIVAVGDSPYAGVFNVETIGTIMPELGPDAGYSQFPFNLDTTPPPPLPVDESFSKVVLMEGIGQRSIILDTKFPGNFFAHAYHNNVGYFHGIGVDDALLSIFVNLSNNEYTIKRRVQIEHPDADTIGYLSRALTN